MDSFLRSVKTGRVFEDRPTGGNAASVRILEKTGLQREGLLRGLYRVRGRRRDRLVFACRRSDLTETPLD